MILTRILVLPFIIITTVTWLSISDLSKFDEFFFLIRFASITKIEDVCEFIRLTVYKHIVFDHYPWFEPRLRQRSFGFHCRQISLFTAHHPDMTKILSERT